MKPLRITPLTTALSLLPPTQAINFWVTEVQITAACPDIQGPCGNNPTLTMITQNSNSPGCVEFDHARSGGGWPPEDAFHSVACGVEINFYKDSGGQYVYYKANGNGTPLGTCVPRNTGLKVCLGFGYLATIEGRYACTNYRQVVDGINPCQS